MNVKVYVEGGGNVRELRTRCRKGFSSFFGKANLAGRMPQVIACGGRHTTYDKFAAALRSANDTVFVVLLVDSEGPVAEGAGPWRHLQTRDKRGRPHGATDDNAHLMVQCMEAWFLADKDRLATFFGRGFNRNALPCNPDIEQVAKTDVLDGLKGATRQCRPKGEYGKGRHSFEILAEVDPAKVVAASKHARRLIKTLTSKANRTDDPTQ